MSRRERIVALAAIACWCGSVLCGVVASTMIWGLPGLFGGLALGFAGLLVAVMGMWA